MSFGEKLQKLRKEKGWTQEELAAQICISRQALSKWEQGTVIPDGSMAFGSPARVVRSVTEQDCQAIRENAQEYVSLARAALTNG